MTNPPIPIGLMTIVKVIDVGFSTLRPFPTEKWPKSEIEYQHHKRMMAWRPKELHEFWLRLIEGRK